MRSLGYLKMVVERLLDTVDIPKVSILLYSSWPLLYFPMIETKT